MAAQTKNGLVLLVTRIPWTIGKMDLKLYFGQFGAIKSCFLPFDPTTGFHKGRCKISFMEEEGLINALQKDPHILDKTKILVQKDRLKVKD